VCPGTCSGRLPGSLYSGKPVLGAHNRISSPLTTSGRDEEVSALKEKKVKRMNINVEVPLHDAFKAATAARGENMTDILMKFIADYVAKNAVAPKKKKARR
jgi:hypothetical protein